MNKKVFLKEELKGGWEAQLEGGGQGRGGGEREEEREREGEGEISLNRNQGQIKGLGRLWLLF